MGRMLTSGLPAVLLERTSGPAGAAGTSAGEPVLSGEPVIVVKAAGHQARYDPYRPLAYHGRGRTNDSQGQWNILRKFARTVKPKVSRARGKNQRFPSSQRSSQHPIPDARFYGI